MFQNKILELTRAKKIGHERYMGYCPLHNDKRPSLSITYVGNSNPLIYCHAECDFKSLSKYFYEKGCWHWNEKANLKGRKYVFK